MINLITLLKRRGVAAWGTACLFLASCQPTASPKTHNALLAGMNEAYASWNFYRHLYMRDGQVISLDENNITTSEGQGYAMLRAVWADDPFTFDQVWTWTRQHLQVRGGDRLFAWKWTDGKVEDYNSAADADTDIALGLILAARRFGRAEYQREALEILNSIWRDEVIQTPARNVIVSGNWSLTQPFPALHVGYLAPYAYEVFSAVDKDHPWESLVDSAYDLLDWIYFDQGCRLPPEIVYLNPNTGDFMLSDPITGQTSDFSYDDFPIFWRVALDAEWFGIRRGHPVEQWHRYLREGRRAVDWHFIERALFRRQDDLRRRMLSFFNDEWNARGRFLDHYDIRGNPRSDQEGEALYATVHSLALVDDRPLASTIWNSKLAALWKDQLTVRARARYYSSNWLWFDRAFELHLTRRYDEFLGFLRSFDTTAFAANFPLQAFVAMLCFYVLAKYGRIFKFIFLAVAIPICLRYLVWRGLYTLNFVERTGPFVSISLWLTECYSFFTILLVLLQVGLGRSKRRQRPEAPGFYPSVDIFIPIYSEPLDILQKTLIGARAIDYPNKSIYVCDDSHRPEVEQCAARYGAHYIKGPKKHAKAGNLNHAMPQTSGELLAIFDTDHIPTHAFLKETVPYFIDPEVGFIQTPHHFYNDDIFQRAFRMGGDVPGEQDMFHHAIQGNRDAWGGAFFVGSGAVFRRTAIEEVGGFKLMSITEDVHTSLYLHEAGWKCVFVDKDLAVGLNAENLRSHVIQRRRWMLGALQIFFRDNPLIHWKLHWRHALGYFASLSYFFFPIFRVMIWITPMWYLLFHWHPILTNFAVLAAYLLPYLVAIPMISDVLLPGWPRLLWGELYDAIVTLPLLSSMFHLLIPKKLGFKVTPKGITSDKRRFDWRSAWMTLGIAGVTVFAMGKGFVEFFRYGIEQDAYFFNLIWAALSLIVSVAAVVVAWERPQLRAEERLRTSVPFRLNAAGRSFDGFTQDVSLSGLSFSTPWHMALPETAEIELAFKQPVTLHARMIYDEPAGSDGQRCGWAFGSLSPEVYTALVLNLLADDKRWARAHHGRIQSNWRMAFMLLKGVRNYFKPLTPRRRRVPRQSVRRRMQLQVAERRVPVVVRNHSADGVRVRYFGRRIAPETLATLTAPAQTAYSVKVAYAERVLPCVWNAGLTLQRSPSENDLDGGGSVAPLRTGTF